MSFISLCIHLIWFALLPDGAKVIDMVKNYATQYCTSKSLPFSAAVMALDCVSAAVSSVIGDSISQQAIDVLVKNGHKKEVCQ